MPILLTVSLRYAISNGTISSLTVFIRWPLFISWSLLIGSQSISYWFNNLFLAINFYRNCHECDGAINKNSDEKKILIFVGVNGSGKTTTLGKIANKILLNKKILIAACDTFRAAAVEQLEDWSNKNGNDFISGNLNQDPASVAYKACEKFKMENYDYLLVDTAGRLSNNTNLINQLIKLKKVITRFDQNFNLETILQKW